LQIVSFEQEKWFCSSPYRDLSEGIAFLFIRIRFSMVSF